MAIPTPAQIAQVQTNLARMQKFNDWLQLYGQPKITNAYLLFSEPDPSDPGLTIALNLLQGMMTVLGGFEGAAGAIMKVVATFVSGQLNYWTSNAPPRLNGTFASYLTRFAETGAALDLQLATYGADPVRYWDTQFTFNGNTATVGDLANGEFPVETDPVFEAAGNAALFTMEQTLWSRVLFQFYSVMHWLPAPQLGPLGIFIAGDQDNPPIAWAQSFYSAEPSYRNTWSWLAAAGGCSGNPAGWEIQEYELGKGTVGTWVPLNRDACNYLFIDSTPGTVTNPNGLFTRETVFTGLNLPQQSYTNQDWSGGGGVLSFASLRAIKEGRTLSALVRAEGRQSVTDRVIAKCKGDPSFCLDLQTRPRETVEKFLGVTIPEPVAFHVIVENPQVYALVIPHDLPPLEGKK